MWYSAKLLYKILHLVDDVEVPRRNMYEESIILLKSNNEENASKKAIRLAKKNEVTYKNVIDEDVYWKFIALIEVQRIFDKFDDGCEVSSRLFTNLSAFKRFDCLVEKGIEMEKNKDA